MTKSTASSPSPPPAAAPPAEPPAAHFTESATTFMQWLKGKTRRAHWTRVFLRVVLPILLVALLGMGIGWAFRTRKLGHAPGSPFPGRQIKFDLTLTSVDPLTSGGIMGFNWAILEDSCLVGLADQIDIDNGTNSDDTSWILSKCPPINIYMDSNLFANAPVTPTAPSNNSIPVTPIFQYFPVTTDDWLANEARFQTNLAIWTRGLRTYATLLNYPFDQYWGEIFMYAQVDGTREAVGLSVIHTDGVAVGYDTSFLFSSSGESDYSIFDFDMQNIQYGSLFLVMYIRRTALVRAYVVTLVLAMWLITLLLLVIVIQAVFFHFEVDMAILAAPVATLFAFTTLRSALPGAPGTFGAVIDFVGTLPALAVLIAIAALCLIHVLLQSKRKPKSTPSSDT